MPPRCAALTHALCLALWWHSHRLCFPAWWHGHSHDLRLLPWPQVLSALFDRLHVKDGAGATREDSLCSKLREHAIPLPTSVLVHPNSTTKGEEGLQGLAPPKHPAAATPRT